VIRLMKWIPAFAGMTREGGNDEEENKNDKG
jgi:hypothetical protein